MGRRLLRAPLVILIIGIAFTVSALARTEGRPELAQQQATSYPAYPGGTANTTATAATPTRPLTPAARTTATSGTPSAVTPTAAPLTPTERAQVEAPTSAPTLTPSATVELNGDALCTPGSQITISGKGPRHAPILLYFDQRVVGGGSVEADGTFALPLLLGVERPGDHTVSVRVRGSGELLTEFTCSVPAVTPTPLPVRRPIP